MAAVPKFGYNPNEPRDDAGKWTTGGDYVGETGDYGENLKSYDAMTRNYRPSPELQDVIDSFALTNHDLTDEDFAKINAAMKDAPRLPADIVVYRGIETDSKPDIKTNARMVGDALQSVSLDPTVADTFASLGQRKYGTLFEIHIKTGGVPAVPVRKSGQSEFVLPPMRDLAAYKVRTRNDGGRTVHEIVVTGYHPTGKPIIAYSAQWRFAYNPDEARDDHGRWTTGGGGGSAKEDERYLGSDGKYHVGDDVDAAARLISTGKDVVLDQPRQLSTLLDRLKTMTGNKVYDLCHVSVSGTNLFCSESKGYERVKMPQLSGVPKPGSIADRSLPKDPKTGKADASGLFVLELEHGGTKVSEEHEDAAYLRASQRELDGRRVAQIIDKIKAGKGKARSGILVSKDNYIVDGHHHWAAHVAMEYASGKKVYIPVRRVNTGIVPLLHAANAFADRVGLKARAVGMARKFSEGTVDRLKFADIKAYPIFEVGTWNGMEFTEDDIAEIAKNYDDLHKIHQVPLKLGHDNVTGVDDGQPALGWITRVWQSGGQLLADMTNIPKVMADAISKGLYRKVSVELLCGAKFNGKTLRYILDAVAILGATHPAVRTLPDLSQYLAKRSLAYDEGGRRLLFESDAGKRSFKPSTTGDRKIMDEEERKKLLADTELRVKMRDDEISDLRKQLTTEKERFAAEESRRIKAEQTVKELQAAEIDRKKDAEKASVQMKREAVKAVFEQAVKDKIITPGQRDSEYTLLNLASDERAVALFESIDALKEKYKAPEPKNKSNVKQFKQGETARSGSDDDLPEGRKFRDPHREIESRINELRRADAKLSYAAAKREVFVSDPELAREYVDKPAVSVGGN